MRGKRLAEKHPKIADRITPQMLSIYFRYIRNLSLMDRRLTPDLYTLIVAAQADRRRRFCPGAGRDGPIVSLCAADSDERESTEDEAPCGASGDKPGRPARMGHGPDGEPAAGPGVSWRKCELRPRPEKKDQARWRQRWDPFGMCSYPPEDDRIESFHRHVRDQAKAILGADLCAHREVHDERPRWHRRPRNAAELAHRRALRESGAAGPRLDRSRGVPVRSAGRPGRSIPTGRPGMPSTSRNRPWLFMLRIR